MSARLASGLSNEPRRFFHIHGTIAAPRWPTTVPTREPGGSLRGPVSSGTSAWAWRRNVGGSDAHVMCSRSSTHGPCSVNEPHARSDGWAVSVGNDVTPT